MKQFSILVKRNISIFFKDKGLFFTSLITPLILLVLYGTFLGNVFKESYISSLPDGASVADTIINGLVGGQIFASIIAVSCVTVAFCSNMLMVQDKISGARKDLLISPLDKSKLALSYFVATFFSTLIVCLFACLLCFIYVGIVGWYYSFFDVIIILIDVVLLTLFGTLLSSIVNHFLSSQGQISAVGSIVSSVYGFICGAYMPIASFSAGLQGVLKFLPGTYATSLIKNHTMSSALDKLNLSGVPSEVIDELAKFNDLKISLFGSEVSIFAMYAILIGAVFLLLGVYIAINKFFKPKRSKKTLIKSLTKH